MQAREKRSIENSPSTRSVKPNRVTRGVSRLSSNVGGSGTPWGLWRRRTAAAPGVRGSGEGMSPEPKRTVVWIGMGLRSISQHQNALGEKRHPEISNKYDRFAHTNMRPDFPGVRVCVGIGKGPWAGRGTVGPTGRRATGTGVALAAGRTAGGWAQGRSDPPPFGGVCSGGGKYRVGFPSDS